MTAAEKAAEELRFVARTLLRRVRTEAPEGVQISCALHSALKRLEESGPMTTADLARLEFVTPQTMGAFVAEMEERGLVSREDDPTDGRRKLVHITKAGTRLFLEARQHRQSWLTNEIERQLSPDEQRLVLKAMQLLRKVVES